MKHTVRPVIAERPLNESEEKLIAILSQLESEKSIWAKKVKTEESLKETQERIESIEKEVTETESLTPREATTFWKAFSDTKSHYIAVGAVLCLGASAITSNKASTSFLFFLLGAVGGTTSLVLTTDKMSKEKAREKELARKINALRQELGDARKTYAETSKLLRSTHLELPTISYGTVNIPLASQKILNRVCLVDKANLIQTTKLKSVVLKDLSLESERIIESAKRLDSIPVLLSPCSPESSNAENQTLHGEESELKEAVSGYITALSSITDEELELPIVNPQSPLGMAIKMSLDGDNRFKKIQSCINPLVIECPSSANIADKIKRFEDFQKDSESISDSVLMQLDEMNSELKRLCERYKFARQTSTNQLHSKYYEVLNRANWCSKKFYCPRSILSFDYLNSMLGLDFNASHLLGKEELIEILKIDPVIEKRITQKAKLLEKLVASHQAVNQIIESYQLSCDEKGLAPIGSAAEYILDQYNQELALFRRRLTEVITGSPYGLLDITDSARLYYDPRDQHWSSPVIPYTYTTTEVEQYGQVLKTDVDLLIPLWEHLWTEKADFTKSELFRTNESIQRMSEKEGEKIKQISSQFKADLREVRSNMNVAKAEFDAKKLELKEYKSSIEELELLDLKQLERLQASMDDIATTDLERSEDTKGFELILEQESLNQLLRRQSKVQDPINTIKSPNLIIKGQQETDHNRLLGNQQV